MTTVAILNSKEENNPISFTVKDLGLPKGTYLFYDVWSGEKFVGDNFSDILPARGSRMFAVCKTDGISLLDCNFRVKSFEVTSNTVRLENDYAVEYATMAFSRVPKTIYLNGEEVEFTVEKEVVCCSLNTIGKLEIIFGE